MNKLLKLILSSAILFVGIGQACAQGLPSFVLGCSYGSGQAWYRLVSNGKDVYFASIVNQVNINAARKSVNVVVDPREIRINFQQGDGSKSKGVLARDTLFLQIGSSGYSCEKISDGTIFQTLKSAYENTLQKTQEKQKAYDNRPNKL